MTWNEGVSRRRVEHQSQTGRAQGKNHRIGDILQKGNRIKNALEGFHAEMLAEYGRREG